MHRGFDYQRTKGFALLALFLCQGGYAQAEWSRFRGPNGTGISTAKSIPSQWTDDDYNWRVELPGIGHSSPVVWKKRIFVTAADTESAQRSILCLDASDGHELWREDIESTPYGQHASSSYADATPAVDEAGVVVSWTTPEEYVVMALDFEGNEKWRRDLGPFVGANGAGVSPIIVDDLVIVSNSQDDVQLLNRITGTETPDAPVGTSSVVALDRVSGNVRWQLSRKTMLASYATPCIREIAGGDKELLLTSTAHGISAVNVATGELNWEIRDLFKDRCVASPILAGDLVIGSYGHGVNGEFCVAARAGSRGVGDSTTLAYEIKRAVPLVPTPLYRGGLLFLWCDNGVVSCLDAETGEVHWRKRVGGNFFGSPVWVDQRIYCIAKNGDVVVLAASPNYELLARVPLGQSSYATPAISDGVMYLRTESVLFSLGGN